ncbi:MAG: formyltetrahydrofolate deformylase [Candidatus Omnitrophica bacterium]|nr:formyltetrahydrofolate deformylase [Candidatus Omnitrophota bacterium]
MTVKAILLIWCADKKGIVARVTNFIAQNGGNIENADQHIDEQTKTFFMRIEWSLDEFGLGREEINKSFSVIADEFSMRWELSFSDNISRIAIFVSRQTHCLYDLLFRYRQGRLKCEIPLIIGNHSDAASIASAFNIPFFESIKSPENKNEREVKELEILNEHKIDTIVLARYMQIFSPRIIAPYENRIINIHHSFLPAFIGSKPYEQASRRGVKIIGATSHYLTSELDSGPIIEQDIVRITHRDSLDDMRRRGEDLERIVLGRAVRLHLEKKILVYDNKTVIFE